MPHYTIELEQAGKTRLLSVSGPSKERVLQVLKFNVKEAIGGAKIKEMSLKLHRNAEAAEKFVAEHRVKAGKSEQPADEELLANRAEVFGSPPVPGEKEDDE